MMTECKVPVFVSPQSLTFSLDDKSSHRQIITLFNPYDFPVRFKGKSRNTVIAHVTTFSLFYCLPIVFCTCTKKYTVVEPEGSISASSRVDIVVRHNAPAPAFCDIRDKFRIQMQYYTTKKVIGHKDVETILVRSSDNFDLPAENFKQLLRSDEPADNYDSELEVKQNFNKSKSLCLKLSLKKIYIFSGYLFINNINSTLDSKKKIYHQIMHFTIKNFK